MRTLATFLSTALLTVAVAGAAFAQAPDAANNADQGRQHHGGRGFHMMQRLDANQDGRIEVSELPPRMREHLAAADTNGDGVLAPEELRAHFEARRTERRAQMDTNHDGTISPEEFAAAREARMSARFARLDTNGDGVATAAEVGPERWAHVGRADANGDGAVTRDELRAMHRGGFRHGRGGPQE